MVQAPAAADTLLKGEGLPDYQAITPEAVNQGMTWLLEQLETELARIESNLDSEGGALRWDGESHDFVPAANPRASDPARRVARPRAPWRARVRPWRPRRAWI